MTAATARRVVAAAMGALAAGCEATVNAHPRPALSHRFGTHWAGAMSLTIGEAGPRLAVSSHGDFIFGQDWSRQTQEGLVYETTFYGPRLAQVRVSPYIILDQAQPDLTDPETDGAYVQKQVFGAGIFELP